MSSKSGATLHQARLEVTFHRKDVKKKQTKTTAAALRQLASGGFY
jgi:pyrimidine operon attenuation protein/uracil phosphoribosyltransferase